MKHTTLKISFKSPLAKETMNDFRERLEYNTRLLASDITDEEITIIIS